MHPPASGLAPGLAHLNLVTYSETYSQKVACPTLLRRSEAARLGSFPLQDPPQGPSQTLCSSPLRPGGPPSPASFSSSFPQVSWPPPQPPISEWLIPLWSPHDGDALFGVQKERVRDPLQIMLPPQACKPQEASLTRVSVSCWTRGWGTRVRKKP